MLRWARASFEAKPILELCKLDFRRHKTLYFLIPTTVIWPILVFRRLREKMFNLSSDSKVRSTLNVCLEFRAFTCRTWGHAWHYLGPRSPGLFILGSLSGVGIEPRSRYRIKNRRTMVSVYGHRITTFPQRSVGWSFRRTAWTSLFSIYAFHPIWVEQPRKRFTR